MSAWLDIYRTQLKRAMAINLQYRVAMLIWLIGMVVEPVIYLVVWSTVARSSGGRVGGFAVADFAAYFIALMLVNHATFTWIMFEFEYNVRHGRLSPRLLRPIHPIHSDIADNIGYKVLTLVVMLPVAAILVVAFRPSWQPLPWALLAFVPALVLAFLVRFMVEWSLALSAFWVTRLSAINQIYFVTMLFLSGQIAPLTLFPPLVQTIASFSPFRWMVAFPVELLLGRLSPAQAAAGFLAQLLWLALGYAIMSLIWREAIRRYSAVGA